METKLRRSRSALITDGGGIIAFGLWSIIKMIIQFASDPMEVPLSDGNEPAKIVGIVIEALVLVFLFSIVIFTHLYIGISAYREGMEGRKRGSFYLVAAGFVFVFLLFEMTLYFLPGNHSADDMIARAAAFFIDITKALIMLDMIIAAVRSRILAKRLEQ